MTDGQTSFDVGEAAARKAPTPRVSYLAGVLSAWTFGERKPKQVEREAMIAIAMDAVERAVEYGKTR